MNKDHFGPPDLRSCVLWLPCYRYFVPKELGESVRLGTLVLGENNANVDAFSENEASTRTIAEWHSL